MRDDMPIFAIGDVHGHLDRLVELLRSAGLTDARHAWSGGRAAVWFVGDFVDRGPHGLGVIDLVMRLQREAAAAGGSVGALIGNHEPVLLAAHRFGRTPCAGPGGTFLADWQRFGTASDLAGLTPEHVTWLSDLPAMALVAGRLLIHADATFYTRYGDTVDEVNAAFRDVMHSHDTARWDLLLSVFFQRFEFAEIIPGGAERAAAFLRHYGGRQIVHGHTPISNEAMRGVPAREITEPYIYASELCVNVDGAIYQGGPGFVYRLPPANAAGVPAWPDGFDTHFRLERLADGVYAALAIDGGAAAANCGIVDLGDRTLVFDTGISPLAARLLRDAAEALTGHAVAYVVNSHWHLDHVRGNAAFPPAAEILATEATRALMATRGAERLAAARNEWPARLAALEEQWSAEADEARRRELEHDVATGRLLVASLDRSELRLPDRTFDVGLALFGTRRTAEVISRGGGHTASDAVLYLPEDRIAFVGDLLVDRACPRQPRLGDGDPRDWTRLLDELETRGVAAVVAGHGPVATAAEIRLVRDYLGTVERAAADARAGGLSAGEVAWLLAPAPFDAWAGRETFGSNVRFMVESCAECASPETRPAPLRCAQGRPRTPHPPECDAGAED